MKDGIILFLKENIIGRNLFTEDVVYKLENGKLEGVYSDRMIFSDLVQTENGFKFNMTTITHELIYNVDNKDNRTTVAKDYTGTSVFCYELAMRKSTNAVTGCFRFISASGKNVPAEAVVSGIYDVRVENSVLKLSESQVLYRDQPIQDGRYKPVAFQAEHRFYCMDGKLHYEYDGRCFDVDAKTMQRRHSSDTFPPFFSIEK